MYITCFVLDNHYTLHDGDTYALQISNAKIISYFKYYYLILNILEYNLVQY